MRLLALLAVCLLGCVGAGKWAPLYSGPRAQPDAVAHLSGYLEKVDGQSVRGRGHSFELMPGCHMVTTPANWGYMSDSSGLTAITGNIVFPMEMRAGHEYVIVVQPEASVGGTRALHIRAEEKDAKGTVTRTFARLPAGAISGPCTDAKGEDITVMTSPS